MKGDNWDLPLQYSILSQYYDALSQGDVDAKNQIIERILKKHRVKTVLDFTCGTGAQALWLAKRGYQVTGADLSPELLAIARSKGGQEEVTVDWAEGDMRTLRVGTFDAVITIFNAIGHLSKRDFEQALKNIRRNLKEDGFYLFDIFNLDALTDDALQNLTMDNTVTLDQTTVRNIQTSELDRERGQLTSYDRFEVQHGKNPPEIFEGTFVLQLYTARELRMLLQTCGFETIQQCGLDGSPFTPSTTENILTVAQSRKSSSY